MANHGSIRAAIYCRVSGEKQADNSSLPDQEMKCRAYAAAQGWIVEETLVLREVFSGAYLGRDELERLRGAISRRQVDRVIVLAGDRFGRDAEQRIYLRVEAERYGVKWVSVLGDLGDDTPEGKLISYISGYAAQLEREAINRRTRAGLRHRVESGRRLVGAKPPYGYRWLEEQNEKGKWVKTRLELNEAESEVIHLIYSRVARGDSLSKVVSYLNENMVPTPNPARSKAGSEAKWHKSSLHGLLRNPIYKGESYSYRVEVQVRDTYTGRVSLREKPQSEWVSVSDAPPAVISAAAWNEVAKRLEAGKIRSPRTRANHQDALLRGGFIRCAYCGNSLHVRRIRGRAYYACKSEVPAAGCRSSVGTAWGSAMAADTLDHQVWSAVQLVLANPAIVQSKLAEVIEVDVAAVELASINKQLAEVARKEENLVEAISLAQNASATFALTKRLESIGEQRSSLNRQLIGARSRSETHCSLTEDVNHFEDWCSENAHALSDLDFIEKRARLEFLGVTVRFFRPENFTGRWEIAINPAGVSLREMQMGQGAVAPWPIATAYTSVSSTRPPAARCR